MKNNDSIDGLPPESLSSSDEAALANEIQKHHREEDINKLAMHSLHEAIPYIITVSHGKVAKDEAMSLAYAALVKAARNFKRDRLAFFAYAKPYLRGELSRHWQSIKTVKNSKEDIIPISTSSLDLVEEMGHGFSKEPEFHAINIREHWQEIQPALRCLTERERTVLQLFYESGFNLVAISRILKPAVSREAIRICRARAMHKLRRALVNYKPQLDV